jgi:NADH:ubiquinone oxidoreductase subunit 2 (subunit N)
MNAQLSSLQSFFLLAPEIVLVAAALVAFLGGAFAGLRSGWAVAFTGIVAAMLVAGGQPSEGAWVASGGIRIDAFSTYIRWIVLSLGASLALVQAGDLFRRLREHRGP